jgi:hypothetical protein
MKTFLLITKTYWEEPPRVRHQVAQALARSHKVVFVAANKFGFPKMKIRKITDNYTVIQPYFPVDMKIRYRLPIINEIYQKWLFGKFYRRYQEAVVINFDYTANLLYKYFEKYIYYCHDNFVGISKRLNPRFISRYHQRCEAGIAEKAALCISVIKPLQENLKQYNPHSFEILIGSPDIDEYQIDINYHPQVKKQIQVGLVGFIKFYNTSHVLVNKVLEDPNFTLTIIGPVDQKFLDNLKNKENLILTGPLKGKELFTKLNSMDVAISPYHQDMLDVVYLGTGSKFYQYFAVGKPIVFAPVFGIKKMSLPPGFVYIAENEDDFPKLIYKAVEENSAALVQQRIQYARDNSWAKRAEQLLNYCNEFNL